MEDTTGEPSPPRRDPLLWAVGVLVVLILAGLAALLLVDGDGDGDDVATVDTAPEGAQTVPEQADGDDAGDDPGPTSPAPPDPQPTTTALAGDGDDGAGLAAAATTYLGALAAGDLDAAWARTSPGFQAAQDRGQWARFWQGFDRIEVVGEPRVDAAAGTVVVPLSFDGAREDYRLTLTRADGGWLVDGPTGR